MQRIFTNKFFSHNLKKKRFSQRNDYLYAALSRASITVFVHLGLKIWRGRKRGGCTPPIFLRYNEGKK